MSNQAHWIRIQYDPDAKHFMVDGAYKHTPGNLFIDGYTAHKRLQEYIACMMHEVEDLHRKERKDAT